MYDHLGVVPRYRATAYFSKLAMAVAPECSNSRTRRPYVPHFFNKRMFRIGGHPDLFLVDGGVLPYVQCASMGGRYSVNSVSGSSMLG
jgi:hypothetical protein